MGLVGVALILVSLVAVSALPSVRAGFPPAFDWIRQYNRGNFMYGFGVAADATGAYMVGLADRVPDWNGYIRRVDTEGDEVWYREFGTPEGGMEQASRVATDASGAYVIGWTLGTFPGEYRDWRGPDGYIRKYDPAGNVLWTDQWGSGRDEYPFGVAVDSTGVYVSGSQGFWCKSSEAFVRKYDPEGALLWARVFSTAGADDMFPQTSGTGAAADGTGVYVTGSTAGAFPGEMSAGGTDVFVRKYSPDGDELWTHQSGTSASELGSEVAVDATGVYVVGDVCSCGGSDVGIYKFEFVPDEESGGGGPSGVRDAWKRFFGTPGEDHSYALTIDATGVYVAGRTDGVFPGQSRDGAGDNNLDRSDAFVRKYSTGGDELWTLQFGTPNGDPAYDNAEGISASSSGVYVAGTTQGTLEGSDGDMWGPFLARWAPEPLADLSEGPTLSKLPPIQPPIQPPSPSAGDMAPQVEDDSGPSAPVRAAQPVQVRMVSPRQSGHWDSAGRVASVNGAGGARE